MSGEDASSSGARSGSGGRAEIPYDYSNNTSKHESSSNHNKPPMFNGDPEMFSWWKTKMYSHVIGMDDELWDVLEDGVGEGILRGVFQNFNPLCGRNPMRTDLD